MGTNYYYEGQKPCKCCHRAFERKHIGKSSAGWNFALRVYPDEGIHTLTDWLKILCDDKAGKIYDEYETEHTVKSLLDNILNRSHPKGLSGESVDGHTYSHNYMDFS